MLGQIASRRRTLVTVALVASLPVVAQAQTGQLTGVVTHAETAEAMGTVQVTLQGTGLGGLSGQDGRYTLSNLPPGTYTLTAQRIGFQRVERAGVTVTAGSTTTLDLQLFPAVLALQGIVAAGLVDPVEGVRSPISVARVTREQNPVAVGAGSALNNLQGMVAGLQVAQRTGEPGADSNIMLRSSTSVMSVTPPLIVVDGVILGSGATNIESMDIESIEVVKGAAAASLYGSRAAAGVIVITTARGQGLEMGQTRFQLRSETGRSWMLEGVANNEYHAFLMDPARTTYVDVNGNPVPRANRVAPPSHLQFSDKPYPGHTYDNLKAMFPGGVFETQSFSLMQNGTTTNFAVALNRMRESGPLLNNDGYERGSFRVNMDHRFLENLSLGVSSFHSRDALDVPKVNWDQLYSAPRDVDVTKRDENGRYIQIPDPLVNYENPLWLEDSREDERRRVRTLGSVNLSWEPYSWFSFMSNVSYDRQDASQRRYLAKGTPRSVTDVIPVDGILTYTTTLSDTWNGEAQGSLRRDFGPLNVRTTVRGLLERSEIRQAVAQGSNFFVEGVPRIDAAATRHAASLEEEVSSRGFLWDTALDYDGKYILTVLGRRDGSSLFGSDNRWHNYYRVAGAWRIGEETWFNVPHVDEFKLSAARGTAGGRPGFSHQYETWQVSASGVSKGNLGNHNLRPEHTTENEVSLRAILFGRLGVDITQAWQRTTDQIVLAPLAAFSGYGFQWSNGGAVEGNTTEFTLEAQVIQRANFAWTSNFVFHQSEAIMVEWPFPSLRPGHRVWAEGESLNGVYGTRFVESINALSPDHPHSPHHNGRAWESRDEFMINDEGWLVWVGKGNHFTEGMSKGLWGTNTVIGGIQYEWGIPFWWLSAAGAPRRERFGTNDQNNFGWANNFRLGSVSLHAHLMAVVGQVIVDHTQSRLPDNLSPKHNQFGKPDELKKPARVHFGLDGPGGHYHKQHADFLKLRALSANYQLGQQRLARLGLGSMGMQTVTLGLVGRDLISLNNCICPNPEMSYNFSHPEGVEGLGNIRNWGVNRAYPASSSVTLEVGVTF